MNNCTDITPLCPVEATTYGYYPHLGGNIVFLVLFAILCCCQVFFGVRYRVWAYSAVTAVGCMGEAVGYGGRLIMNKNPWSDSGFQMQIVCLILSPSFIAAGIYLTFKHLTLHFGPEYSRIKPFLYTWIFIGCDITSILLQAAGGGVAGSAGKNDIALLTAGNNIMIAGIAFQVATMTVCGVLAVDFGIRLVLRRRKQTDDKPHQADWKARVFCAAVGFSYITLLIRCVYRLVRSLLSISLLCIWWLTVSI